MQEIRRSVSVVSVPDSVVSVSVLHRDPKSNDIVAFDSNKYFVALNQK